MKCFTAVCFASILMQHNCTALADPEILKRCGRQAFIANAHSEYYTRFMRGKSRVAKKFAEANRGSRLHHPIESAAAV